MKFKFKKVHIDSWYICKYKIPNSGMLVVIQKVKIN